MDRYLQGAEFKILPSNTLIRPVRFRPATDWLVDEIVGGYFVPLDTPCLVSARPDGYFDLIDGETRRVARKRLGMHDVGCMVLKPLSDTRQDELYELMNTARRAPLYA